MRPHAFQLIGKHAIATSSNRGLGVPIAVAPAEAGANVGWPGREANPGTACDAISSGGRDIAGAAMFLCLPASECVPGRFLAVHGGCLAC